MSKLEDMIMKYHRIGAIDRAKWLETIDQKIPKSFKERIKKDDKTVLRELILPNWVDWDLLRTWALEEEEEQTCDICGGKTKDYIIFRGKTICRYCLNDLKAI